MTESLNLRSSVRYVLRSGLQAMWRALCLLALVGCAAALPSSPAHLRAPSQQPMRLKGGWLNEKQVFKTIPVLNAAAGIPALFFPKETYGMYGVATTTPMEDNFYQWMGVAALEVATVMGMTTNGFSLHEALGAQTALKALFIAREALSKGGISDVAGVPTGPLIFWIVLNGISSILFLTDGAGTGMDLDNLAKFWGIVNMVHSLVFLLAGETILNKVYSLSKSLSPLTKSVLDICSTGILNLGIYTWLVVNGKSKAEAAMWTCTTLFLLFAKLVATQEWRKWNASNGVGPALWMVINAVLGYNLCRLVRNIK